MPIRTQYDEVPLKDTTVDQVLANRADHLGDRPFAHSGPTGESVSYAELDRRANAVGNALRERGIEKGDRILSLIEDPLYCLYTMFGAHKIGAVYAPINYEFRDDALVYNVSDVDPDLVVVEDQFVENLNGIVGQLDASAPVVHCDRDRDDAAPLDDAFTEIPFATLLDAAETDPGVETAWHDAACIIYTSGTTGRPKGVRISHRWILHNYTRFRHVLVNEEDVVHSSLPRYHVIALFFDVATALIAGASVSLWNRFSTSDFWDRVDAYDATVTSLVSVMTPWLRDQPESPDDHDNTLNKVNFAPLPDYVDELGERFGWDFVTTCYGSTEAGMTAAAVIRCARGEQATPEDRYRGASHEAVVEAARSIDVPVVDVDEMPDGEGVYVGRPLDSTVESQIAGEHDVPVETGEAGELLVRPVDPSNVFDRYLNKPESTLESLGNLWYHTGDALRIDEDDNCFFLGRTGMDVIRRRGENISAMRIEDIVSGHEAVSTCAAFPAPAAEGGEDEVAVAVEPAPGASLDEAALLSYLDERMPAFMQPDHLFVVDNMPTTETNKVEKHNLADDLL